jgi:squalene-hopene/tetraprenyl-beta-curcumene cyclase
MEVASVKRIRWASGFLAACVVAGLILGGVRLQSESSNSWNPKAAATYLDQREAWWQSWATAARDHGTFCVSCHTTVPYALARPALRTPLAEKGASVYEQHLIENVKKRVRLWKIVEPFYPAEHGRLDKNSESRGTEAVLNALILASYDAREGRLSEVTRIAFDNMWALQNTSGATKGTWPWFRFNNEPWEANDSQYYGAALAAVAVGTAAKDYRFTPEIQKNLKWLHDYLSRELAKQSPINRVVALWASTKLPGLLSSEQQRSIVKQVLSYQQADGGWSLSSLVGAWKRADGTAMVMKSDGYATGLILFALEQAGLKSDRPQLERGVAWLVLHQDKREGRWIAYSLNRQLDLSSYVGRFMSDAATAYAVLALTQAR